MDIWIQILVIISGFVGLVFQNSKNNKITKLEIFSKLDIFKTESKQEHIEISQNLAILDKRTISLQTKKDIFDVLDSTYINAIAHCNNRDSIVGEIIENRASELLNIAKDLVDIGLDNIKQEVVRNKFSNFIATTNILINERFDKAKVKKYSSYLTAKICVFSDKLSDLFNTYSSRYEFNNIQTRFTNIFSEHMDEILIGIIIEYEAQNEK